MIWGVDLGVRSVHMAGIAEGPDEIDQSYTFTAIKNTRWEELSTLARLFAERVRFTDRVFIEEPPLVRNVRTLLTLAQTSGALLAVSPGRGYLVPVDTWKKATVGRGGASKELVSNWLADHHPVRHDRCNGDQNLVDATCIALYGQLVETYKYTGEDQ